MRSTEDFLTIMSYFSHPDTTMDEEQVPAVRRREKLRCGCPGPLPRRTWPFACPRGLLALPGGGEGQGAPALGLGEEEFHSTEGASLS